MKKKIIIILIFALLFVSSSHQTFAQSSTQIDQSNNQNIKNVLSVSPAIIETTLKKGAPNTYALKIKNLLDEPLGIRASIGSFSPSDEENGLNFTTHSSLMDMSKVSQDSLIIQSGETKTVDLTINPPKNLKDGGYYEALVLTPFYVKAVNNPGSPTVLTQVAVLIFANSGEINYKNLSQKVEILDFSLKNINKHSVKPLIRVENSYFNHFSAKPFLTLTGINGKSERIQLTEKKILPGKIRRFDEIVPVKIDSPIYKAQLALSVGQGNYVYKTVYFPTLQSKNILLVSILLLIVIFIFWRRRQFKKAIKVLFASK